MAPGRPLSEITGKYPNHLRDLRLAAGRSMKEVATALRVTPTQVSRLERGLSQLSHRQREVLGKLFGVDPWSFYGDGPDPRTQAMLDVFRRLPAVEQDRLIKLGHALAEPAAPFVASARKKRA